MPLIHGPDGAKLSKRHGALGVDAYRAMGYLPAALRNYLVRLGWSHGDEEFFSTEELIDCVRSRRAIGRSPSRFDFAKLENINGHYHARDERRRAVRRARSTPCPICPAARRSRAKLDAHKRAQLAPRFRA